MGLGAIIKVNDHVGTVIDGASEITVDESLGETTHYQIVFPVDIIENDITYLSESSLDTGSILKIQSLVADDHLECLVTGPVTGHEIVLTDGGTGSTLIVEGGDSSIAMARDFQSHIWSDETDSGIVQSIVSKYGLSADIQDTQTRHLEAKHSLVQRASDLDFVRKLARRNGYFFGVSSDNEGVETAHFKPPGLNSSPVLDLIINHKNNNIDELKIKVDFERPHSVQSKQLDLVTKELIIGDVPVSSQLKLGDLSLQQLTNRKQNIDISYPVDDAGDLLARCEAALVESEWFIQLECSSSSHRLNGKLVRTNQLVNLVGAGSRYSGPYLVSKVKHTITPAAHILNLTLLRNAVNSK